MVQGAVIKRYNDQLTSYYIERLVPCADAAFRLALCVLLSPTAAKSVVKTTFKDIADGLAVVMRDLDPLSAVLSHCWKHLAAGAGGRPGVPPGDSPLLKALAPLTAETRGLLFLADVLGKDIGEIVLVTGFTEVDIRKHLARSRWQFMRDPFARVELRQHEEAESEP